MKPHKESTYCYYSKLIEISLDVLPSMELIFLIGLRLECWLNIVAYFRNVRFYKAPLGVCTGERIIYSKIGL